MSQLLLIVAVNITQTIFANLIMPYGMRNRAPYRMMTKTAGEVA